MAVEEKKEELVTPGDVLGKAAELIAGKGAYVHNGVVYASLAGHLRTAPPPAESADQEQQRMESTPRDHEAQLMEQKAQFQELREWMKALSLQNSELLKRNQTVEVEESVIKRQGGFSENQFGGRSTRFNGEDLEGWLFRCDHFFEFDETPEGAKLKLATIHLEGKSLQWHQSFVRNRDPNKGPLEYSAAITARFSGQAFQDPLSDLKNLNQVGSLQEYLDNSDALLNKVVVTEENAISLFLGGLRTEIQNPVRMFRPQTLHDAFAGKDLSRHATCPSVCHVSHSVNL